MTGGSLGRWLDVDGRIVQYPRKAATRAELLAHIGAQAVQEGERIAEAEVNARLARFTDDIPALRRYLVVAGILDRADDGSAYWRAPVAAEDS